MPQETKTNNLLIDAGPLSLILIGFYDSNKLDNFLIGSKKFDKEDFKILLQFLQYPDLFVTPQILAEANNIVENSIGRDEFKELK